MKTAPHYRFALVFALALSVGCDEEPIESVGFVPTQTAQPERGGIDGETGSAAEPDGPASRVPDEPSTPVEEPGTPGQPEEEVTPGEGGEPTEPPAGGELTITRVEVPDEVLAQTHALSETSWVLDRPAFGCESTTGEFVAANVYELVNEGGTSADLRIGVRTAENGVSLTLPGATLYAYSTGILPETPHACTLIGESSSTFASELGGITLAPGESIDFIVAGADRHALGTYQVTIIRADMDTAPDVTPEPEPETDPRPDPGPAPEEGPGCSNDCAFSGDGTCDDGGPGSTFGACEFGTDCTDCGVRGGGGGGGGVDPEPPPSGDELCNDSCPLFAADGACDDGGAGSLFPLCDLGTDCTDCGPRAGDGSGGGGGGTSCTDTCTYFADGDSDDGGPGSAYSLCDLGTDCFDCGPR